MRELEQDSFPIMTYLKIFFRRKEFLLIPTFIGLVLGVCSGMILPKEYRSQTVILVQEGKTDNPLFDKLAVSTTVKQRLDTIRESLLGWNSVVELIKRLKMDQRVRTTRQFEELVKRIRSRVSIRMKAENIIYLSYTGYEPVQTQAVVQNITDIFVERNREIQSRETADAIAFIEEQLKVYKGKIKSAEIAKLQDHLDDLLLDSTEKHPLVRELRERITAQKAELEKEQLEYTQPDKLEIESNEPLIESIQSALGTIEAKTAGGGPAAPQPVPVAAADDQGMVKFLLLEKLDNVLARDVKINEGIYNSLLQRLETAKITQRLQSSKEGTRYTVLEPPRVPLEPFKPNRFLIALAGLVLGCIGGLCLVVATEFLDKSFLDVQDAKEFLGVPLMGAISKINTEDTIRQERDKQRWLYSLTVISGIVVVVITVTISNFLK